MYLCVFLAVVMTVYDRKLLNMSCGGIALALLTCVAEPMLEELLHRVVAGERLRLTALTNTCMWLWSDPHYNLSEFHLCGVLVME